MLKEIEGCPTDNLHRSPLHCAAANGDIRCVRFLIIKFPASLKMKDTQGNTPLETAKHKGHSEAAAIIEVYIVIFVI